jgi:hypothetical protein
MSRQKRTTIAISLLLLFAATQINLVKSFARDVARAANVLPQQPSGVLSTQGNQPITVNGVSTNPGATILTGASIETPSGVWASIDFGPLGSLQIDPGSRVIVEFQDGMIKVTLLQGCVTLRTKRGTRGEIDRAQGVAGTTDGSKDDMLHLCTPGAVPPPVNDGGGALGAKVLVPVFAGTGAVLTWLAWRGNNPSQTTP